MMKLAVVLFVSCLMLGGAWEMEKAPSVAEVVALDECDPATFNAPGAVGAEICK